jgi:PAS domain S-box-containing protein
VCARSYGAKDAADVVGKKLTDLFGTATGSLDTFFRNFIENSYQIDGAESSEVLPDGTRRHYANSGHATIESGKLVRVWGAYRDITDRKQAEEELRASESRFRALVEHAGDAFFLSTMDGEIIDVNQQACRSLGYTREELLSMTLAEIDLQVESHQHKDKFWSKLVPGLFTTLEGLHRRKNGSVFPVEVRAGMVEIGETHHMLGLARNVSERRRAEEELAKTQALLSAAVEQTPAGIILADAPDVRIRVANSAALGIRGESVEPLTDIPVELHPQRWQTYYPDGSQVKPEDLPLSQAVLKGRTSRNVEVIIRRSGGEDRWVLANAAPVRNQEGEVIAGVVVFPDVTELKRAEEALRHEKERAQLYLDIAEVILLAIDADQRITLINRKGCDLLGYEESELLGQNWFDLCLPAPDRGRTRAVFDELMSGEVGLVEYHENFVQTNSGEQRLVAWHNAVVRDDEGRFVATFSSGEDITERRRMQEALIQTEKMMTVGGLAAGMAHEINSPLSGILQGVENTLRRISPGIPANQEEAAACGVNLEALKNYLERRGVLSFLSGIQKAGMRAARIVSNMLQFSRPSETELVPTDLSTLLNRTIDLAASDFDLKKEYDFRSIQIERDYDDSLKEVPCAPAEMEQVVMNLIRNAAHAMAEREGPAEPPRLTLRTRREDGWARIEIEDNGPGMSDETRRRAFEPFFTTKGISMGTGLGLSVSYFIVTNNHRGTIDVESESGEGCKFIVRLPLQQGDQERVARRVRG